MSQHKGADSVGRLAQQKELWGREPARDVSQLFHSTEGWGEQADNQPKRGLCGRRAARLMLMEEGLCLGAFMRQGQKVDGSKAEQRVRSRVQKEVTRAKRRVRCHGTKSEILGEG